MCKCKLEKNKAVEINGTLCEKNCCNQECCCDTCGYEECHEGCEVYELLGSCENCPCRE